MPTELALLSDVPVTAHAIVRAAAEAHPDGSFIDYHDGLVRQVIDDQGLALLQVYPSRPVHHPREAAAAVDDPPASFALWTDLTIPFGDPAPGRAVAHALAVAVGGVVKERT